MVKTFEVKSKYYHIPKNLVFEAVYKIYCDLFNKAQKVTDPAIPNTLRGRNQVDVSIETLERPEKTEEREIINFGNNRVNKEEFISVLKKHEDFGIFTFGVNPFYEKMSPFLRLLYRAERTLKNIRFQMQFYIKSQETWGRIPFNEIPEKDECIAHFHKIDKNEFLLLPESRSEIFIDPSIIHQMAHNYSLKKNNNDFIDTLINIGIPEKVLHNNQDLWSALQELQDIKKNKGLSKNMSFYVKDNKGVEWLLKFTDNKKRAFLEAAANYYLSEDFDFILPGKFPEPLQGDDMYMVMQKSAKQGIRISRGLDHWLACLAYFHKEAESILKRREVDIPKTSFRDPLLEKERYLSIKKEFKFNFDDKRLEDAINYLTESPDQTVIHNDIKPEHLHGKYLLDLELISTGNPGIDLSSLFSWHGVPFAKWDDYLKKYLGFKGVKSSLEKELKEIKASVIEGCYVSLSREIISSTLRFPYNKKISKRNNHLAKYLNTVN